MSRALVAAALVLGAGLLLVARRAQAAPAGEGGGWTLPSFTLASLFGTADAAPAEGIEPQPLDWTFEPNPVPTWAYDDMNTTAFLAAISYAEGTARAADPYRVVFGYGTTLRDLSDHPAITGEWTGAPLDSLGPSYRGKISTAAGRYQIIRATWLRCRAALGLRDFGPASQDAAALWLIERRGALDLVRAGRFDEAVTRCASEWASLPGSTSGQPQRRMAELRTAYVNAGGALA